MSTAIPGLLIDAFLGVLVAGVVVGGLVPATGGALSSAAALGVGAAILVAAVAVGRLVRRTGRRRTSAAPEV